jgi:hypothetical protein
MGGVIAGSRPSFVLGGALAAGSLVTYVIGPPLHHLQRGNPRGAMRSALARLGLPIAGALVAHLSDRQASDDRAVIGAVIGVGAAMIVDAAVIARMPARTVLVTASGEGAVHIGIAGAF